MIVLTSVLGVVVLIQQVVVFAVIKLSAEERRRFLAAVMSKDPGEYVAVERATSPRPPRKRKNDEPVPPPVGL